MSALPKLMTDENILAEIQSPVGLYLSAAFKAWATIMIFLTLLVSISFIFHDHVVITLTLLVIFSLYLAIHITLYSLRQRHKKRLLITNYKVIKQTEKEVSWVNLEEIKDLQVLKTDSIWGDEILISAGNKLRFQPVKNADDLANYILKMQRRRKDQKNSFPLYKKT